MRQPAPLLNKEEREGLRKSCQFNAQLMDFIRPHVKPGVATEELDRLIHGYTLDHGHIPATLNYGGSGGNPFPKSCCISINNVVCHGIPDATVLKEGDIVNVDLTTIVEGWFGDQSETFAIGEISQTARDLIQATFDSLFAGIHAVRIEGSVYEIGQAILDLAGQRGFGVVREYQGHGVGRAFHQSPDIPHYPLASSRRQILLPGMAFTIEPMLNEGTWRTDDHEPDGWTVRTKDRKLSAQFEHTILVTEQGPEILTLTKDGPQEGNRF